MGRLVNNMHEVGRCHELLDMLLDENRHIWACHTISNLDKQYPSMMAEKCSCGKVWTIPFSAVDKFLADNSPRHIKVLHDAMDEQEMERSS